MTPNQLRQCLSTLGWSGNHLARLLNRDPKQIKRWTSGQYQIPTNIAEWLKQRADITQLLPPPP
jgi:ribosome-binding protein aMBF1 (putative translation factor)